ncbi:MAG: YigZ family protein [Lentisphaeria bacterium]|nr:YigZ family protein [Lentisphaeria bacterium]
MLVLKFAVQAETWAKNSRFLAEAIPVSSPEEAKRLWRFRKETYDNGGHIVYAFTTGPAQNISGCSDDGEPSGTAGRPVLAVLKGSSITNCLITVARWFGGTKLGTGGLVHAYSDAAKAALANAVCTELLPMTKVKITIPYQFYEQVKRILSGYTFTLDSENFASEVTICGEIFDEQEMSLHQKLNELANGKIIFDRC